MQAITIRDALFEAILHHFRYDPKLIAYGEENREWGGAFGVYRGLAEILPYHRLFNAPISEAAIVATAVGYAMEGGRALVELMYADFIGRAGDEIFNQMAKWQAMSGGAAAAAGGAALLDRQQVRRPALAGLVGADRPYPGAEDRLSGDPLRRQGADGLGARRRRPGRLLREPAALRHGRAVPPRGRARRLLPRARSACRT